MTEKTMAELRADFEIERLTHERDEARDELDGIAEVLDEASVPQGVDGPDGRRWTLGLGARVEHVIAERDEARAEVEELRTRTAAQLEIETRARDAARAEVEKLRALPSAEDLEERAHEILDGAGIPTHALDPVSGEEDYRADLEERLEWTVEEITRLRRALEGEAKRCAWTYDETHFAWDSACGKKWILMDGGPSENEIRFCHGCGKPVEVACKATPEKARQGEGR